MESAIAQTVIVVVIVAAAAGYLLRTVWRQVAAARRSRNGCDSGCGCSH
jgi:hypothetical protein